MWKSGITGEVVKIGLFKADRVKIIVYVDLASIGAFFGFFTVFNYPEAIFLC